MAKGFKTGGGFGKELSFRVLGGVAQPAPPRDKDVWIETEALTGWVFSAVEPESPYEGMVWILTGDRGTVSFDALKKNGIRLIPVKAKQYTSGAWTEVPARSYIGGTWVKWLEDLVLFDNGDTLDAVTGGWKGINGGKVATKSLYLGSEGLASGQIWTKKAVDVTGYSKLKITIRETNDTVRAGLLVDEPTSNDYGSANNGNALAKNSTTGTTLICDVAALSGGHHIWITRLTSGGTAANYSASIAKVELLV